MEKEDAEFSFEQIYFDTNILWEGNWPSASIALTNALTIAHEVGVQCFIPEPVAVELAEKFAREMETKSQEVNRYLDRIRSAEVRKYHTRAESLDAYRVADQAQLRYCTAYVSPFTRRPLDEVFRMCASHEPPFDQDQEFRDRIIWLSIVDHLSSMPNKRALFVSADKGYDAPGFRYCADNRGVQIVVRKRLEEAVKPLQQRHILKIRTGFVQRWEKDNERARLAVASPENSERIKAFISTHLEIPRERGLCAVKRLDRVNIESVQTALPTDNEGKINIEKGVVRMAGTRVNLSIDVEVELEVTVQAQRTFSDPPPLRIGDEIEVPKIAAISVSEFSKFWAGSLQGDTEDKIWKRTVRVEASALYDAEKYSDVQPTSLQLIQST